MVQGEPGRHGGPLRTAHELQPELHLGDGPKHCEWLISMTVYRVSEEQYYILSLPLRYHQISLSLNISFDG